MHLPPDQVQRFFRIWKPLLLFVNRRKRLVPGMLDWPADHPGPWRVPKIQVIRDALWADDALLDAYVTENPAGLDEDDLATARGWHRRVAGLFFVLRHLKKHSLFLPDGGSTVYGVLGISGPLEEFLPYVPEPARAVLIPWEGRIIYDSLIEPLDVVLGSGIRAELKAALADAKERGAVVTSLEAADAAAHDPAARRERARATNAKVLDAFRTYLYAGGYGPRVAERDLAHAAAFAQSLESLHEPRTLREFQANDVATFLPHAKAPAGAVVALKRVVTFLRDTGRMDYDAAQALGKSLRAMKGK